MYSGRGLVHYIIYTIHYIIYTIHYIIYSIGVPVLRTLTFVVEVRCADRLTGDLSLGVMAGD